MSRSAVRFGAFLLDPADRRLSLHGETIGLNARYLDALILLVDAAGELVAKERFMDEVWRGVPVTDEALTQAIRTLRRTLGDSASAPTFIETVPKHGYRFIASIEPVEDVERPATPAPGDNGERQHFIRSILTGGVCAMIAGAFVGLLYGFVGIAQQRPGGGGGLSLVLVLVLVSMVSAGVAGAGIAAGLAASRFIRPRRLIWTVGGGGLGGLTVGAFANLIGSDAFRLLFGQQIGAFAGATEGLIFGSAIGLAASVSRNRSPRALGTAVLLGAGAGLGVALIDGRMMAGSLESLVTAFPSSQFRFGDNAMGPVGHAITALFEGVVFTLAMAWASRMTADEKSGGVTSV